MTAWTAAPSTADEETAAPSAARNRAIDGWRAVAACCVVFAHAANYRFVSPTGLASHYAQRIGGPLADFGVQLFFVISGYIITSLLLREERQTGRVSITAFYIRRVFRILPPLLAYLAIVAGLRAAGLIALPSINMVGALTFTCNVGIIDCYWWVAHTWSLAVEEQFYLAWPMLFVAIGERARPYLLALLLLALMIGFALRPLTAHSNFTSFGCIAAGALYASSARVRGTYLGARSSVAWVVVMAILIAGVLSPTISRVASCVLPLLMVYVIFVGNALGWVRAVLEHRLLQIIGLASYSLYLWQQLFLARPALYFGWLPTPLLLPFVVAGSVWLVERPFIRWGHRLSSTVKGRVAAIG